MSGECYNLALITAIATYFVVVKYNIKRGGNEGVNKGEDITLTTKCYMQNKISHMIDLLHFYVNQMQHRSVMKYEFIN